jgi:hypothetical protein
MDLIIRESFLCELDTIFNMRGTKDEGKLVCLYIYLN